MCTLLTGVSCASAPLAASEKGCDDFGPVRPLVALLTEQRQRNQPYLAPSETEQGKVKAAAIELLRALAAKRPLCAAVAALDPLGLALTATSLGGAPALALVEKPGMQRGAGIYVFRRLPLARPWLVQVPHSFYDEGTLPIGLAVAERGATALFVNSVHRYPQGMKHHALDGDEEKSESRQDLAHRDDTVWQAMSAAALATWPSLTLVQVHGFADGADPAHAEAIAIVSPGPVQRSEPFAAKVAARLGAVLGPGVLLYGRDTEKLGGTKNAQGALVAPKGQARFVHIELSKSTRRRLTGDSTLLDKAARAVMGDDATRR